MTGLEHLKSKRYWALILLGPPLRVIFAYALFAGLHLGLGLPWPTLKDAGLVVSMLEVAGFIGLFWYLDGFAVATVYKQNVFRLVSWGEEQKFYFFGCLAAQLTTVAGFAAVLSAPLDSLKVGIEFGSGGWTLLLILLVTVWHFVSKVMDGERAAGSSGSAGEG